jgi:hypothetical protein
LPRDRLAGQLIHAHLHEILESEQAAIESTDGAFHVARRLQVDQWPWKFAKLFA